MSNPFEGKTKAEMTSLIEKASKFYFARETVAGATGELLPRVGEVLDSMIARLGEKEAVATLYAALLYVNFSNMAVSCCGLSGAGPHVAESITHTCLDFIMFQGKIDPQEMFAILRQLQIDIPNLMEKRT